MKDNEDATRELVEPSHYNMMMNYQPARVPLSAPLIETRPNQHLADLDNSVDGPAHYDFSPIEEDVETDSQIFDSTQIESGQRPTSEPVKQSLPTKPKKKSANPFASKPKGTSLDPNIGLGGGETIFDSLAKEVVPVTAVVKGTLSTSTTGKRKQGTLAGFIKEQVILTGITNIVVYSLLKERKKLKRYILQINRQQQDLLLLQLQKFQ